MYCIQFVHIKKHKCNIERKKRSAKTKKSTILHTHTRVYTNSTKRYILFLPFYKKSTNTLIFYTQTVLFSPSYNQQKHRSRGEKERKKRKEKRTEDRKRRGMCFFIYDCNSLCIRSVYTLLLIFFQPLLHSLLFCPTRSKTT